MLRRLALAVTLVVLAACGGGYGGGGGYNNTPHKIDGRVTSSGAGVAGVTVTLSGYANATTTTAVDGSYEFSGLNAGSYQVTPSQAGQGFAPVASVIVLANADSANHDFARTPLANPLSISGTISGLGSVSATVTLGGDASGQVLTGAGGTYSIAGLRVGNYTLTPSASGGYGSFSFAPTTRAVVGEHAFDHNLSGGLGAGSLVSVLYNGNPVTQFFELPNAPAELTGTIRARRTAEIAAPDLAAFQAMWTAGGTVVVTYTANATNFAFDVNLADYPNFSLSSVDGFIFTESLILATGNDFVATP